MRISDWSSDVCSSDLDIPGRRHRGRANQLADPDAGRWPDRDPQPGPWRGAGNRTRRRGDRPRYGGGDGAGDGRDQDLRSEEHTSELQSLMRISYAVFCLKKKKKSKTIHAQKQLALTD